jgi:hypothetical protein
MDRLFLSDHVKNTRHRRLALRAPNALFVVVPLGGKEKEKTMYFMLFLLEKEPKTHRREVCCPLRDETPF